MISALFVRNDSIYKQLGVDCWDIERNASKWPGGNPIIAHPPCRAWGQLAHMAKPRLGEMNLAIQSVWWIRKFGGVLEHPATSKLWNHMHLPKPGKIDDHGGFSILVHQSWWGHKCEKKTLLYICGVHPSKLPKVPIRFDRIDYVINSSQRKSQGRVKKEVTKKEREATPVEFAKWLIEIANQCITPIPYHG